MKNGNGMPGATGRRGRQGAALLAALLVGLALAAAARAADYYVATNGDDGWDGAAPTYQGGNHGPWKSFWKATLDSGASTPYGLSAPYHTPVRAGDTVYIRGGDYYKSLFIGYVSGASGAYITFRPYQSSPGVNDTVVIHNDLYYQEPCKIVAVSYIRLQGLTFTCDNGARHNAAGISVNSAAIGQGRDNLYVASAGGSPHHIVIDGCECYNNGSSGIGVLYSDYVTVQNCRVHDNCWDCDGNGQAGSGISFLGMVNTDGTSDYGNPHYRIRNNTVYNNYENTDPATYTNGNFHSDGNGIIYDTNKVSGTPGGGTGGAWGEIVGNTSYHNGGRGVHVFQSGNVQIHDNNCYENGWDGAIEQNGDYVIVGHPPNQGAGGYYGSWVDFWGNRVGDENYVFPNVLRFADSTVKINGVFTPAN